jgi:hypothetical protein
MARSSSLLSGSAGKAQPVGLIGRFGHPVVAVVVGLLECRLEARNSRAVLGDDGEDRIDLARVRYPDWRG